MGGQCYRPDCQCCSSAQTARQLEGIEALLTGGNDIGSRDSLVDEHDRYSRSRDYGYTSLMPSLFSGDVICSECDRKELNTKLGQSVMPLGSGWICNDPQCSYFDGSWLQNRRTGSPLYNRGLYGGLGGGLRGGNGGLGRLGGLGQMFGNAALVNNPRDIFTGLGGLGRGLNARFRGFGNQPIATAFPRLDPRIRSPFRLR